MENSRPSQGSTNYLKAFSNPKRRAYGLKESILLS